jgi:hypothetical protein
MVRTFLLICLTMFLSVVGCDSYHENGKEEVEEGSNYEVSITAQQLKDIIESQRFLIEDIERFQNAGDRESITQAYAEFMKLEEQFQIIFDRGEKDLTRNEAASISDQHMAVVKNLSSVRNSIR